MNQQEEQILDKTLPLNFRTWLHEFLGSGDNVKVGNDVAALISVVDYTEVFTHVEYPNELNNYVTPVIWRIKAWREYAGRRTQRVTMSALENKVYDAERDLIRRLIKQLIHAWGDSIKRDIESNAAEWVKKREYPRIKFFSCNLDALIKADKELLEYNKKLAAKKAASVCGNAPAEIQAGVQPTSNAAECSVSVSLVTIFSTEISQADTIIPQ